MSEENQKKSHAPSKSTALTKEDILRITSLPVKKMRVGNIVQDVVCDEATGYIYYVNPNATGLFDRLDKRRTKYDPEKMKEILQEKEKAEEQQEQEEEAKPFIPPKTPNFSLKKKQAEKKSGEADDVGEKDTASKKRKNENLPQTTHNELKAREKPKKEKKPRQNLKRKIIVLGCAVAVIAAGACAYPIVMETLQQRRQEPTPPTPTVTVENDNASIVQVVNDLIPGDIITADDLKEAVVAEDTYSQITLQGINLYQWSRADALVGMYAQTYLPAGQYVSFSSIGASYEPPQSLWTSDSYLDIPLPEEQQADAAYLPGQKINVVLRKQVTQESPVTQSQDETQSGGTSTTIVQTTTIDEFSFPNTTICDVLTGDGTHSLYQSLHALSTVPAGEQSNYINRTMQREEFASQFQQKTLRIALSKEDIDKLGKLDFSKTQVSITPTDTFDKADDDRASAASAEQATMKNVLSAREALAQTGEEETP